MVSVVVLGFVAVSVELWHTCSVGSLIGGFFCLVLKISWVGIGSGLNVVK